MCLLVFAASMRMNSAMTGNMPEQHLVIIGPYEIRADLMAGEGLQMHFTLEKQALILLSVL